MEHLRLLPEQTTLTSLRALSVRYLTAATMAVALHSTLSLAQEKVEVVQIANPAPPAEVTTTKAEPTAQEQRLAELLKLKFERTPASILGARATLVESPVTIESSAGAFDRYVVAGRWKEVGAYLKALPSADAAKVYEAMLQGLGRAPANPNQGQQVGLIPAVTLLQDDILELADVSPGDLTETQLKQLGELTARTLGGNSAVETLVQALNKGTQRFGGTDPAKRELAAQLLIHAKAPREAAAFLPPLEPGKETASLGLLEKHVICALEQGRQEQKEATIQRAWDLNQTLLRTEGCPPEIRERAWARCGDLARLLPPAAAVAWIKETLVKTPAHAPAVLMSVAGQIAADRGNREPAVRRKNLELQRSIVEAVLPANEQRAAWQRGIDLFALNWLEEADHAKRTYVLPRNNQMIQYDDFGNRVYYGNQMPQQQANPNQLPGIPINDLLTVAPGNEWRAALDPSLLSRVLLVSAEITLKIEDDGKALPYVEQLAPLQPKEARRLGGDLLRVWGTTHDPRRGAPQRQGVVYYNSYNPYGMNQGIPLTRVLQKRNLDDLAAVLERLRKLPIEPLDDSAVVSAFTAAHSQAEVFREESIERVLGKVDALKPETLWEVMNTMRQRLASQWRKPSVQQQAKTQRTDVQVDAEVLRGYELLGGLIDRGLKNQPDNWRMNLARAATTYDQAEFQYGKKVDLAIYVAKREQAFDAFQRAADLYAAGLPKMEQKEETPLIYQLWLNANLGASDLAMVTRQQEASAGHLGRITAAMQALGPEAAERHRDALAKAVIDGVSSLPAHLKPGYMRAALTIVGKRTAAEGIENLVTYYDGLLEEVEATMRVDGDTTVGHDTPFGVFFSVRHTAELERENAGGFGKYLRNQSQYQNYYNPYGTPPIDHRDDLEKQIREKLGEGFEILSLTFHDEKVQSRGYGRPGWRETPLLYLLLKAKDASVDRIPAVRLDLDFADSKGPVVLPVTSAVQLIDARPAISEARPVTNIELAPVLDARALREGKLALEIKATAKGIVPSFKELFDFTPAGYKIDETTDSGPAVVQLDSQGDALTALSERTWMIKMSIDPAASGAETFKFPTPKQPITKAIYKRYEDSDLVEVSPDVALTGLPLRNAPRWPWYIGGGAAFAMIGLFIARSRRRPVSVETAAVFELPATITPFSMIGLLRKIQVEKGAALSSELQGDLTKTIADLESRYFAPSAGTDSECDLSTIGRRWIEAVRGAAYS